MQSFDLRRLLADRCQLGKSYLEFLRVPALSVGVYHLQAGQTDPQRPHTEDEVYYVVSGRSKFLSAVEVVTVEPGAILFVERGVEHRFFDITEDLTVLVFFAPAESMQPTQRSPPTA
jgi:mannose-6-phosphate isomerase-like protein (cupin superfamily)